MRAFLTVAALTAAITAAVPTSAATLSLNERLKNASSVEVNQVPASGAPLIGRVQQFRNGDSLVRLGEGGGEPLVLTLCNGKAHMNLDASWPGAPAAKTQEEKQMRAYGLYMAVMGGMAMAQGIAGDTLELPAEGQASTVERETSWAYGKEQYAVTVNNDVDGELRIRVAKTGNTTRTPSSGPDDIVSTNGDKAARLAELEPVGTARELVIASSPMGASVPDDMSLKGWMSASGKGGATVGAARKASGDCGR
ncbi:hypothetical protein [Stenotrophomonas sp. Ker107b]